MADNGGPQIEDGYTRFANELLEALCKLKCRNHDIRLVMAIGRITYGWGEKSALASNQKLSDLTALPLDKVCRARLRMSNRNIIKVSAEGNTDRLRYSINKHYKRWLAVPRSETVSAEGNKSPARGNDLPAGGNPTSRKKTKRKPKERGAPKNPPAPKIPPPPYDEIIEYLNESTGSKYSPKGKEHRAQIRARFRSGFTLEDFKAVIDVKTGQWLGDPKMVAYLRPSTLFRPTNFEDYLQEARREKRLGKSKAQVVKERKYFIAKGILDDEGQEPCLAYCKKNRINPEDFKAWITNNLNKQ